MVMRPRPHLLNLPPEIRESIYKLLLNPTANRLFEADEYSSYDYREAFVLFKINSQICIEARKVFRDLNVFVRIETPWPEALEHVQIEGHVPILMKKDRARRFTGHSMSVVIDAPPHAMQDRETVHFVILLDDLDKFTKTWFYADLSHPGMNGYLSLALRLRDPYTPEWDEKRMPKWLQQKLLLPFGMVKGLREMVVDGDPKPFGAAVKELRELQAVPYRSAEYCLQEATRKKEEGNTALRNGNFDAALKLYTEAWEAMHVIVKGRSRHIHADAFFGRELREDPFIGKNGQAERLILRVQLVANTCQAYLKLEDWEETRFWGMRSIRMLREAMGADDNHDIPAEDEAVLGFPAADQMGKIYYRTAYAFKKLDDIPQARKLLRVASIYLPRDESVRKELQACALQLG